ncbi:stage II sporulation protein M [Salipaludibacillus neizhouensis]|uniref:Stage II sporulation protein M n=2 Tax=Bacillaceae TaxID=186817 RepID=A0A3A9KBB0_9BACI|nr:stage II sporulation protein M [Salipaludibacillus neizhouensis]
MRRNRIFTHLSGNKATYIFSIVLILMGVIFGAVIVNSMNFTQKNDLYAYLTLFFSEVDSGEFANATEVFTQSFAYYIKIIGCIWLLGLSVIGLPVIYILLFIKGLMVGFTVGFLVDQMGFEGFIFAFSAVFPQNIVLIPLFIIVAAVATTFSLKIWRQIIGRGKESVFTHFIAYTLFLLLVSGGLVVVSLYEAFVSPSVMKFIVTHLL